MGEQGSSGERVGVMSDLQRRAKEVCGKQARRLKEVEEE